MSNASKARRREIVERVRQEGYQACLEGKSCESVPREYVGSMDAFQWRNGWEIRKGEEQGNDEEAQEEKHQYLLLRLNHADDLWEIKDILREVIDKLYDKD